MTRADLYFKSTAVNPGGGSGFYVFHQYPPISCHPPVDPNIVRHTHTMTFVCARGLSAIFLSSQFGLDAFDVKTRLTELQVRKHPDQTARGPRCYTTRLPWRLSVVFPRNAIRANLSREDFCSNFETAFYFPRIFQSSFCKTAKVEASRSAESRTGARMPGCQRARKMMAILSVSDKIAFSPTGRNVK